jgi:predicted nucleic acid-binding protein
MFTIDTSSLVAFFAGDKGKDVDFIERVLSEGLVILCPTVISEILSDPKLPIQHEQVILSMPCLEVKEGFWTRVGHLRRTMISKKLRARLADSMITQFCLDYKLTLITRDDDFKNFRKNSELNLGTPD